MAAPLWAASGGRGVLASLLLAASICGAAGEHASQAGNSGLAVAALLSGIPQIICLIVVGRLRPPSSFRYLAQSGDMIMRSCLTRRRGCGARDWLSAYLAAAVLGAVASLLLPGQVR